MLRDCKCLSREQLADFGPDSDLDFLCKNCSPSSCGEVFLRNTATYTTPWDPKPAAVPLGRGLASKFPSEHSFVEAECVYTRACEMVCMCKHQLVVLI